MPLCHSNEESDEAWLSRDAVTLRCAYTPVRRARWCLAVLHHLNTPPLAVVWFTRFSLINHFVFQPPRSTYAFVHNTSDPTRVRLKLDSDEDAEISWSQSTGSAGGAPGQPEMLFLPWNDDEGANKLPCYALGDHDALIESALKRRSVSYTSRLARMCRAVHCAIPCGVIQPRGSLRSSHVAIFFHSNGIDAGYMTLRGLQNIADTLEVLLIVPEYPGYGLFCGRCTEADVVEAMTRLLRLLFLINPLLTPSQLVLIGHSIGTGVAMYVAHSICDAFHRIQERGGSMADAVVCAGATMPLEATHDTPPTTTPQRRRESDAFTATLVRHVDAGGSATLVASSAPPVRSVSYPNSPTRCSGSAKARDGDDDATQGCAHCALGGIVLIAPYASIRCIEDTQRGLRAHHATPIPLLLSRQLHAPTNSVFEAPKAWARDEEWVRATDPANVAHSTSFVHAENDASEQSEVTQARAALSSPRLFQWAYSFTSERFATIDVARTLQHRYAFFQQTPLLLIHGLEDQRIPALHSIAIASAIRSSRRGGQARVCLVLLTDTGHDGAQAEPFVEHFYRQYVLLPQLDKARRRLVGDVIEHDTHRQMSRTSHEPACHGVECGQSVATYSAILPSSSTLVTATGAGADNNGNADLTAFLNDEDAIPDTVPLRSHMPHDFYDALQELPPLLPGSPTMTALHLSMLGFAPRAGDVGSITLAAMRRCGVPVTRAADMYTRHRRRIVLLSALLPTFYALLGVYVLILGITHAVLAVPHHPDQRGNADGTFNRNTSTSSIRPRVGRANKVVVWAVLECVNLLLCMLLRLLHPLNGFHRKRQCDSYGGSWLILYLSLHLFGALLSVACGVLIAFIFALAPPAHGGVRWDAWSTLGYRRRVWVSLVPRWTMVALACMHLVFLLVKVLTNR